MWIFTEDGFYSAVKKDCGPEEILVRARVKGDLNRLLEKLYLDARPEIITLNRADYRYRVAIPMKRWAEYCRAMASEIDYSNFKDTVAPEDHLRHDAYMRCWSALHRWQEDEKRL